MQLQVELVHAGGDRLVVLVTGWHGDHCLGSALGEAAHAEEAEDRAVARLQQRLASSPTQAPQPAPNPKPVQGPSPVPGPLQSPDQGQAPLQAAVQAPAAPPRPSPGPTPERGPSKQPSLPGGQPKPSRPQAPGSPSPFPAALTAKPAPGTGGGGSTLAPAAGRPRPLSSGEAAAAAAMDPVAEGAAGDAAGNPTGRAPDGSAGGSGQLSLGSTTAMPAAAGSNPSSAGAAAEQPAEPEDWSDELAALDIQLQRLGWQRDQEAIYLQRAFGHPSRSRLTSYGDLVAYLAAVRPLQAPADPASVAVPLRRVDLLAISDQLLTQLGWDAARGRQALEHHFERSSRQQLNDEDLLRFNMILEGELITGEKDA